MMMVLWLITLECSDGLMVEVQTQRKEVCGNWKSTVRREGGCLPMTGECGSLGLGPNCESESAVAWSPTQPTETIC